MLINNRLASARQFLQLIRERERGEKLHRQWQRTPEPTSRPGSETNRDVWLLEQASSRSADPLTSSPLFFTNRSNCYLVVRGKGPAEASFNKRGDITSRDPSCRQPTPVPQDYCSRPVFSIMADQQQHPRPDAHPVRLVYRPHAPPGQVFWDPEDIKQHQRRRLEEEFPIRDEIALDRLQIAVEKEFATECTRCQGRAGSYRCSDCHQRTHQIDGLLDFAKDIAITTFRTRTRHYRSRLNYEEVLTQQRKKLNQELRRRNDERRQIDKAAAESLGQVVQTAYSTSTSMFGL